ncbi:MAG: YdeI/OmpD-associated family protein [Pseudomonadota bacterium]
MTYFTHEFEDVISLHGVGKSRVITYKVLLMPPHFEAELPFNEFPRLRVEGEISDVPVRGAWMPVGDGRRYFIVSPEIKKNTGLDVGDLVEMRFRIDDQDFVEVPPALQSAIDRNKATTREWEALTPGKKRMFAFHVASAKSTPTKQKRINEAIDAISRNMTLRELQSSVK